MVGAGGQSRKGVRLAKMFNVIHGNNVMSAIFVGGVSIRSRDGTPSRKGCVVNGQMTKATSK